jgi:hypothetical protein
VFTCFIWVDLVLLVSSLLMWVKLRSPNTVIIIHIVSKLLRKFRKMSLIRRTACAHAQLSGCSSTTNAYSETRQMAVCYQNLTLGAISSRSALSLLVGALFNKFGLFMDTPCIFSFRRRIQTGCGTDPLSNTVGSRVCYRGRVSDHGVSASVKTSAIWLHVT